MYYLVLQYRQVQPFPGNLVDPFPLHLTAVRACRCLAVTATGHFLRALSADFSLNSAPSQE